MKGASVSFRSADVQSATLNGNGARTAFNPHLLVIGLWVFAGYYLGCKIGFALTFKPHPISVLWPPNSILVAALLLTPPRVWWFCTAGRISGALGGAVAEPRATVDDLKLVRQQLVRSSDWRGLDALLGWRAYSLHSPSQRRLFLSFRGIYRSFSVLVFRRRVRGVESLGSQRLLGVDPNTVIFKRHLSVNHRAVDRNMGHEWSSASENSITFALLGGMHTLFRFVGSQLCCPL